MKGLYFIRDKISGVPYSSPVVAENDAVACSGFISFLEKEKAKPEYFELYRMCKTDDVLNITDSHSCFICVGNEAKEVFENICKDILSKQDEQKEDFV